MGEKPLIEPAAWPWRLPIIRHLRAAYYAICVAKYNAGWRSVGMIPTGHDERVVQQMWRGIV